ncbi:unnamed protein product, partial [Choristocarpus tenellus]
MYPKDRVTHPHTNTQIPPKMRALFEHMISRVDIPKCPSTMHTWGEVLEPTGPFALTVQDWRTVEAFSVELQDLLATRRHQCQNGTTSDTADLDSSALVLSSTSEVNTLPGQHQTLLNSSGKVKGKNKALRANAPGTSMDAATPHGDASVTRRSSHRVTPKYVFRPGEPSAPCKTLVRPTPARRGGGGADEAVASLASSRAGPGAFETPIHSQVVGNVSTNTISRGSSPSRYPTRVRSRRFPQLGRAGECSDAVARLRANAEEDSSDGEHITSSRLTNPSRFHSLQQGLGHFVGKGLRQGRQEASCWEEETEGRIEGHCEMQGQTVGVRTRATPRGARGPAVLATPMGSSTPAQGTAMGLVGVAAPPREGGRVRLPLQSSRYMTRASVGGRNYTDSHLKQLGMIEAAVVGNASGEDHASFNLPRQGRTLTLTNIFKFVALRGASNMYNLARAKRVDEHTGRHSNFFDGKIDARVVGIIKRDIGDEAITKSRKFSKILLSLVAE